MRVYLNHSQSTVIHFFRNDVSAVQVSHTSLLFRDITRSLIFACKSQCGCTRKDLRKDCSVQQSTAAD